MSPKVRADVAPELGIPVGPSQDPRPEVEAPSTPLGLNGSQIELRTGP
jgi:hypothetical protein